MARPVEKGRRVIRGVGRIYLTDFGIARIASDTAFTASGAFLGTPSYMAPEQAMGKTVTRSCDIYSLGIVLYELATGQVPYEADTPFAVIQQHVSAPLPMPRELRPDMPERLEQVILRALSKEPEDRFPSVKDMHDAVEEAITPSLPTQIGEAVQLAVQEGEAIEAQVEQEESSVSEAAQAPTLMAPASAFRRLLPFLAGGAALLALAGIFGPRLLATPAPNPTAQVAAISPDLTEEQATIGPRAAEAEIEPEPTEAPLPEPEPTASGLQVDPGPYSAQIRFTSTSDWSQLDLVSGGRWIDLEILSTSDGAIVELTDEGTVYLNQACSREDECRQIEAILNVAFVDIEQAGQLSFQINRGAWGWSELGILNTVGADPREVFAFRHNLDVDDGMIRAAPLESIIELRSVYVHLGAQITGEGLRFRPSEADGLHEMVVLGGRESRQTVPMEIELEGDFPVAYLYFDIDDDFYFDRPRLIEITVEYFDNGRQPIDLQYDATPDGSSDSNPRIYKAVRLVEREGKGIWRKASIQLEDARFTNQQHGEYDFRLWTGGIPLAVTYVEVTKLP